MKVICAICGHVAVVNPAGGCHTTKKMYRNVPKVWICDYHVESN